jgi:2'-5' RNA ligase
VTLGRYGPAGWNIDLQIEPPTAVESDVGAALRGRGGLAILPQFVGAGIISDAAARELLGFGEDAAPAPEPPAQPPPDPAQPGAAPGQPLQTVQPPLARVDAVPTDACVVLIPAADPGLRGRVEAAIGQTLVAETDPHVTVLYVGTGLSPEAIAEVVEVVGDEVAEVDPAALLTCPTVRVFPPGPNGTPIVLEYGDAWAAAKLNGCLLRVLAHVITAKQHASYRPHLTLGYAPEPVSPEAQAALLGIDTLPDTNGDAPALRLRIPIGEVQVRVGDQVVLSTWAGMDPPEPGDLAPPAGFTRVRGHLRRQGPQEPEPV